MENKSPPTTAMFVLAALDDYGLTPAQFRVLGRIARRGDCHESLGNMAKGCQVHRDTVIDCLRFLVDRNLISITRQPGRPSTYRQNPYAMWIPAGNKGAPEIKGHPPKPGDSCPESRGTHLAEIKGHKGSPFEGSPNKVNGNGAAVAAPTPAKPFFLQLDRKGQTVFEQLKILVPTWQADLAWWQSCIMEDAECLGEILKELEEAKKRGVVIVNPGGWVTARWKQIGGEW